MKKIQMIVCAVLLLIFAGVQQGQGARIKDIADLKGVRENYLLGYGLVVGLAGSGDSMRTGFTDQTMANMLENMQLSVPKEDIRVNNVATVMVTANLPPFGRKGVSIDVVVSSVADADSLVGGTLLSTPLKGPDGRVYAVAQGSLATNALAFGGEAGRVQKNHPTVGRIPNGAIIEHELPFQLTREGHLTYHVNQADFTTVSRIAQAINRTFGSDTAQALDASSFKVDVPEHFLGHRVEFISALEQIEIIPDSSARVVVNDRTGTIVIGQNVRISQVAVSHSNLSVMIRESPMVSQPHAFGRGDTVVVPRTDLLVEEEEGRLIVMDEGVSVGDVANALNAIGATPRDLIAIFQALKQAGALHAELVII